MAKQSNTTKRKNGVNQTVSLEKSKDADFVVLSGAPFSIYTQVLQTYIDGMCVYDRSKTRDWAYQGGRRQLARSRGRQHADPACRCGRLSD